MITIRSGKKLSANFSLAENSALATFAEKLIPHIKVLAEDLELGCYSDFTRCEKFADFDFLESEDLESLFMNVSRETFPEYDGIKNSTYDSGYLIKVSRETFTEYDGIEKFASYY